MAAFHPVYRGSDARTGAPLPTKVSVVVHGELSVEKLLHRLKLDPDIELLDADARSDADIVLALASAADEELLLRLSIISAHASNPTQRTVLVSEPLRERHVAMAFAAGVVSILPHREATEGLIVRTVVSSARGHAVLSSTLTRWLVDESRMLQQTMHISRGLQAGGLTEREVTVFKLLADGHDTACIGEKLSYSERTIKKIVQDTLRRFGFHNRVQAIAYAMRVGAI